MTPSQIIPTGRSGFYGGFQSWLERPEEAFAYFREQGCERVVCQEKHMGSRAIIALCRDDDAARRRFGIVTDDAGAIWTRTGRPFFTDPEMNGAVLERLLGAATSLWSQLDTDWLLLDAEIMPWSAKAESLIRRHARQDMKSIAC